MRGHLQAWPSAAGACSTTNLPCKSIVLHNGAHHFAQHVPVITCAHISPCILNVRQTLSRLNHQLRTRMTHAITHGKCALLERPNTPGLRRRRLHVQFDGKISIWSLPREQLASLALRGTCKHRKLLPVGALQTIRRTKKKGAIYQYQ